MSLVAIIGDCTTTTALAMAATWPVDDEVVVLEADRTGGSLTGWLDTAPTPSLSTIVTHVRDVDASAAATWFAVDDMVQRGTSGVRFIAAPVRAREASRAIGEASAALLPAFASLSAPTLLADCGRHTPADRLPVAVTLAATVVVVHRQHDASALAAGVRLERLAETIHELEPLGIPIALGVIGSRPFDLEEIHRFVAGQNSAASAHNIADDALSAAVLAGRSGVSANRLARLPLMRSVRGLTQDAHAALGLGGDVHRGVASLEESGTVT